MILSLTDSTTSLSSPLKSSSCSSSRARRFPSSNNFGCDVGSWRSLSCLYTCTTHALIATGWGEASSRESQIAVDFFLVGYAAIGEPLASPRFLLCVFRVIFLQVPLPSSSCYFTMLSCSRRPFARPGEHSGRSLLALRRFTRRL